MKMDPPIVILLSGKIESGKNTFASMLLHQLGEKASSDYYARPLKEMCRDAFRPLIDYLNDGNLKEGYGGDGMNDESWFEKKTPITRMILQAVGTEIVRKIDDDYWIKKVISNISAAKTPLVVLTDWRFPNELHQVAKEFNTITIRINRNLPRSENFHEHISETALDSFQRFDYVVENNGSLDSLREQAREIMYAIIEETME